MNFLTRLDQRLRALLGSPTRTVRCIYCASPFVVPGNAEVLTCPSCARRARVDDVVVTGNRAFGRVETCGSVVVRRNARCVVDHLKAGMGILVEGEVQAKTAAAPVVIIAAGAIWQGDLATSKLDVSPEATIRSGKFRVRAYNSGASWAERGMPAARKH